MEFPGLGVHCAFTSCSKLDFLPFECDCCHKIFCREHRVYVDHNCTESYIKDVHIPVCPLCDKPIPVKNGEDPNISVNQHITRDCKDQRNKLYNNKCSFSGCKKKELVQMVCSTCHKNYCIKHRLEADHQCTKRGRSVATPPIGGPRPTSSQSASSKSSRPAGSTARKPQSSLMVHIGADLNRERQERLEKQRQQPGATGKTTLSDDEALAMAVAASLNDTKPSHSSTVPTDQHQQQSLEDDEALARALAASLNERSPSNKSHRQDGKSSTKPNKDDSSCIIS